MLDSSLRLNLEKTWPGVGERVRVVWPPLEGQHWPADFALPWYWPTLVESGDLSALLTHIRFSGSSTISWKQSLYWWGYLKAKLEQWILVSKLGRSLGGHVGKQYSQDVLFLFFCLKLYLETVAKFLWSVDWNGHLQCVKFSCIETSISEVNCYYCCRNWRKCRPVTGGELD